MLPKQINLSFVKSEKLFTTFPLTLPYSLHIFKIFQIAFMLP